MSVERDALDRALAQVGQPITIRRRVGTTDTFVTVDCKASIRGFAKSRGSAASELVGSVSQAFDVIIASPTPFEKAVGWPGAASGSRYPRKGDQALIEGRPRTIEACDVVRVGVEAARLVIQVKG